MAGKGAPEGNQYAKKDAPGRTIGLYITSEEYTLLQNMLSHQGTEINNKNADALARTLFKQAVRRKKS
jgi:hypothetical protein